MSKTDWSNLIVQKIRLWDSRKRGFSLKATKNSTPIKSPSVVDIKPMSPEHVQAFLEKILEKKVSEENGKFYE